jgi:hypothetical protein
MKYPGKIVLLGLPLIFSSLVCTAEDNAENWTLAKEKDGVKVLIRKVKGSDFNEFEATTKIKTSVNALVEVYEDPNKCVDWLPDCKASSLVKKESDSRYYSYTEVNNPWPIQNRDYVLQIDLAKNADTGEETINFKEVKDLVPENKCCVRMSMVNGFWKFTPAQDGYVDVTYRYHFHPGGKLPVSAVNAALPDLPIDTLTKMKKYLEKSR